MCLSQLANRNQSNSLVHNMFLCWKNDDVDSPFMSELEDEQNKGITDKTSVGEEMTLSLRNLYLVNQLEREHM